MLFNGDGENQATNLFKLLAEARSWRDCASAIVGFEGFLCSAQATHWLDRTRLEKNGSEERRIADAIRRLISDTARMGVSAALSERMSQRPLIEEWRDLENIDGGEELLARWESFLLHPDFELLPLPLRAEALNHAAKAYIETGESSKISFAIEKWEEALAIVSEGSEAISYRINLGTILRTAPASVDRSVQLLRDAVARLPPADPRERLAVARLQQSIQLLFHERRDPPLIQELVLLAERSVSLDPGNSLAILSEISVWMFHLFEHTSELALLEGAIELTHLALQQISETDPARSAVLANLGSAYANRFGVLGQINDLNQAISLFQSAIRAEEGGSQAALQYKGWLARALVSRNEHAPDPKLLDSAISTLEDVVAQLSPSDDGYPDALNQLAAAINARPASTRALRDVDRIIALWEQAASYAPPNSREALGYTHNLATAWRLRFELLQDPKDLDRAEGICRNLLVVCDEPLSALVQSELSNVLLLQSQVRLDPTLLSEAIELAKRLCAPGPFVTPEYFSAVAQWSRLLFNRYEQIRSLEDLRESFRVAESALAQINPKSIGRADILTAAGRSLSELYEVEGDGSTLDRAVEFLQLAIDETPPGSTSLPARLNSLAVVLKSRYERGNGPSNLLDAQRVSDLERAIDAAELAVHAAGPKDRQIAIYLGNLSAMLRRRATLSEVLAKLQSALGEQEIRSLPHVIGQPDDLRRALEFSAQAVSSSAMASNREQFLALNNHGLQLLDQYRKTQEQHTLDESLALLERAARMAAHFPRSARNALGLANALEEKYLRDHNKEDRERAITLLRNAVQDAGPTDVIQLAKVLGICLIRAQQWQAANNAFDEAIEAADRLLSFQAVRSDNEPWLQETQDLWKLAAYVRAKMGDLEGAAERLEDGLARQLRETLQLRHFEAGALRNAGFSADAARYLGAIDSWDRVRRETQRMSVSELREASMLERVRSARNELELCTDAIRRIPGFDRFQRSLNIQEIRDAAGRDALIFLVPTEFETFAIIVPGRPSQPIQYLPLPDVTTTELLNARGYWRAYRDWSTAQTDNQKREESHRTLDLATRWLWDSVMGPLVSELSSYRSATLIATGYFRLLPLHAAWTHDPKSPTDRCYAQDRVCFTYAANAGSLAASRQRSVEAPCNRIVAVSDPRPTASATLPYADLEAGAAIRRFPNSVLLRQEGVTKDALLAELRHCDVLHFSGHGFARPTDPLLGGLILARGETLTLGEILGLPWQPMSFAFLSACETGLVGFDLPDESVGLPSGLIEAGVAAVCASMWPVPEDSTMLLCSRFYELWLSEGYNSANALCAAGAWVRNLTNRDLANFFEGEMDRLDVHETTAYELAADRWAHYSAAHDSTQKPFSHPFYWAAFSLSGTAIVGRRDEQRVINDRKHSAGEEKEPNLAPLEPAPSSIVLPAELEHRAGNFNRISRDELERLEEQNNQGTLALFLQSSSLAGPDAGRAPPRDRASCTGSTIAREAESFRRT